MQTSAIVAAAPSRAVRGLFVVLALAALLLMSMAPIGAVSRTRAAEPAPLKAVFIVGPTNALTNSNLADAEALAAEAELWGMDVRRVFFPHSTWENVLANIQGANLVVYMGHGYGWPSPYTKVLTESRQNGMGLVDPDKPVHQDNYKYYGANVLKQSVVLAPNALVFLNHLCYSAGNAEPGMAKPTWDVARQRVDNMANGWLATGARAVFAYGSQSYIKTIRNLMTTDMTVEDLFRVPGAKPRYYYGWIGWDPRKFDSVRTPGATNFLDPDPKSGWYRAVTGDLTMTAREWSEGTGGTGAPTLSNLDAAAAGGGVTLQGGGDAALFTPNGDGVTDSLTFSYEVDKEAFVDFKVRNSSNDVVRNFTSWSRAGVGTATWDGKNDAGNWVSDGNYTVHATPRNRGGEEGATRNVDAKVLTTMRAPTVSPYMFYAADGDNLSPTTTFSVNMESPATFSWKVVDGNNNVVKTKNNNTSVGAGQQTWQWDGRNEAGAFVPDGTYYTVMTAATSAGTYSHTLPVEARAFRLVRPATGPVVRGVKVKYFMYAAELMSTTVVKPKLRVYAPGLAVKVWSTYKQADGGFYANVTVPLTAGTGTVQFRVQGTDRNGVVQYTDYFFPLQ
jgi:flagellar hook assembly protein FlgD